MTISFFAYVCLCVEVSVCVYDMHKCVYVCFVCTCVYGVHGGHRLISNVILDHTSSYIEPKISH